MGVGPKITVACLRCDWKIDSHATDVRRLGIDTMVHISETSAKHVVTWSSDE